MICITEIISRRLHKKLGTASLLLLVFLGSMYASDCRSAPLSNFQGQLLDGQGKFFAPGSYDMEISLYNSAVSGDRVWGPFIYDGAALTGHGSKVYVQDQGHFNVVLFGKDVSSRDYVASVAVATTSPLFIEFRAGNLQTATPLPRQQLLSLPYAYQAYNVRQMGNIHVDSNDNVGINIESPAAKLDVGGTGKARGAAKVLSVRANKISASTGTVAGSLSTKDLAVQGSLQVTGRLSLLGGITLQTIRTGLESHQLVNDEWSTVLVNDPDKSWQCYLSGIQIANPFGTELRCTVAYENSAWNLKLKSQGQVGNSFVPECGATCVQLK